MFKIVVGVIFVVLILGFIVHQDIKEKQHEELKLLLEDARSSIDETEKNKNHYAPKVNSSYADSLSTK